MVPSLGNAVTGTATSMRANLARSVTPTVIQMREEVDHPIVHIAAPWINVASRIRQRCLWCGAVLLDEDMSLVGVHTSDPSDTAYPTWEGFVARLGGTTWVVEHDDPNSLPEGCCANLDPSVTGEWR